MFWAFKFSFVVDILAWRLLGLLFEILGKFFFKSSCHPGDTKQRGSFISVCVMPPKVAKASSEVAFACHCCMPLPLALSPKIC
jgi:hypothetical protein